MDSVIFPGVELGDEVEVGPFCVVGQPYRSMAAGTVTVIGAGSVIRSHTVVYAGNRIGRGFQTGHGAFLRELNRIGDHVSVGSKSIIEHHVTIEDGVRIHSQAFVPEFTHLKKGCWLGPNVVITNARYPLSPTVKEDLQAAVVEEGAIVGANSTLLPGVTIGAGAVVGAGSVVTRDVPPGAVVAGNPARQINWKKNLPYGSNES